MDLRFLRKLPISLVMKPVILLFLLLVLAALPGLALALDRFSVLTNMVGVEFATGQKLTFPKSLGYTYEILETKDGAARVRFFDKNGFQIVGEYVVSKEVMAEVLKADITAGLKATVEGSTNKNVGCCDVDESAEIAAEPKPIDRKPAIEPGTAIVYATPIPKPTPALTARKETIELPKNPPIPTWRPDREEPEGEVAAVEADVPDREPASREPICKALNAFKAKGVPDAPLRQALFFLSKAQKDGRLASGSRYLSLADYSQKSTKKRFYLLDLETLSVTAEKVSHGSGKKGRGDPNHDGMLDSCSTKSGDAKTRAGFFKVGDYYMSSNGRYKWPLLTRKPPRNGMNLEGLSPGVNDKAYSDRIVMHEAKYNSGGNAIMGRSHGCPAFVPGKGAPIIAKLKGGSLYYSYAPMCKSDTAKVLTQVRGWQDFCK